MELACKCDLGKSDHEQKGAKWDHGLEPIKDKPEGRVRRADTADTEAVRIKCAQTKRIKKGEECCFTLKAHRSWLALLLPEVVAPQQRYESKHTAEREMKKLREDAIPPSSLHNSEARRRADDLKCVGARARARVIKYLHGADQW